MCQEGRAKKQRSVDVLGRNENKRKGLEGALSRKRRWWRESDTQWMRLICLPQRNRVSHSKRDNTSFFTYETIKLMFRERNDRDDHELPHWQRLGYVSIYICIYGERESTTLAQAHVSYFFFFGLLVLCLKESRNGLL